LPLPVTQRGGSIILLLRDFPRPLPRKVSRGCGLALSPPDKHFFALPTDEGLFPYLVRPLLCPLFLACGPPLLPRCSLALLLTPLNATRLERGCGRRDLGLTRLPSLLKLSDQLLPPFLRRQLAALRSELGDLLSDLLRFGR
jgi:hypothetical protein